MTADKSILRIAQRQPRQPMLGTAERFRPGEEDRLEEVIAGMRRLGLESLRLRLSWADYSRPGGQQWYDWLLARLAREVEVLPVFTHAADSPPGVASRPPTSGIAACIDFLDLVAVRHGAHFEWLELCGEPAGRNDWDWYLDPDWTTACEIVGNAMRQIRRRGKRILLGGLCPTAVHWLRLNCEHGVLDHCDAVGLHDMPGTVERCWQDTIGIVRGVLDRFDLDPELWITEVGHASWPCDGMGQADALLQAIEAPVRRVYWSCYQDRDGERPALNGGGDERRHVGLMAADGQPKLLSRLLMRDGVDAVRALRRRIAVPEELRTPQVTRIGFERKRAVITGGAGFLGINLADRLAQAGRQVLVFDNLSRAGVEENLAWLLERHHGRVAAEIADVRDVEAAREAVQQASRLFHFAARAAVPTGLRAPVEDFETNARGTLNLLEGMRASEDPPGLVYASSSEVYGTLADIALEEEATRYVPADPVTASRGISEQRPLDLRGPQGCSKGAAEQYVIDYARSYGLPAAVFRMSCVYGPHQRGAVDRGWTADQGWVARLLAQALQGGEIALYGGKQLRDILHVDDLVAALLLAQENMPRIQGQAFNIGGGPGNTVSPIELLDLIGRLAPARPTVAVGPARPGDQRYYVSDTSRFRQVTGWQPTVSVEAGIGRLLKRLGNDRSERAAAPEYERSAS